MRVFLIAGAFCLGFATTGCASLGETCGTACSSFGTSFCSSALEGTAEGCGGAAISAPLPKSAAANSPREVKTPVLNHSAQNMPF